MQSRARTTASGFTLIEVVLVLGLLVVITAFAWPNLQNRVKTKQLPESTDNLRSALRMARASASFSGKRYRLHWDDGAQQPTIQWEVDPMVQGGDWETCPDSWAEKPFLLGDVQVTKIIPGRPTYMTPISHTASALDQDANSDSSLKDSALNDAIGTGALGAGDANSSTSSAGSEPLDRPDIVFDVDGASNWYTLIVSRVAPGQKLDDTVQQLWIVLDGRTGLPAVQQPLTKDQLADITLRPDLDLLQPPDIALAALDDANSSLADASSNGDLGSNGLGGSLGQGGSLAGGQTSADGNGMNNGGSTAMTGLNGSTPTGSDQSGQKTSKAGASPVIESRTATAGEMAQKTGAKTGGFGNGAGGKQSQPGQGRNGGNNGNANGLAGGNKAGGIRPGSQGNPNRNPGGIGQNGGQNNGGVKPPRQGGIGQNGQNGNGNGGGRPISTKPPQNNGVSNGNAGHQSPRQPANPIKPGRPTGNNGNGQTVQPVKPGQSQPEDQQNGNK